MDKRLIFNITSGIIATILFGLGANSIQQNLVIGIISIMIAFTLLYFIYWFDKIRENFNKNKEYGKKISEISNRIDEIKDLINIKSDIEMLKRECFKNEQKRKL